MGSGPLNCGSTRLGPHPCKALQKGIDLRALYSSIHSLGIYITLPYVACNVATLDGISHLAFPVTRLFIDGTLVRLCDKGIHLCPLYSTYTP